MTRPYTHILKRYPAAVSQGQPKGLPHRLSQQLTDWTLDCTLWNMWQGGVTIGRLQDFLKENGKGGDKTEVYRHLYNVADVILAEQLAAQSGGDHA